jgi:hypothetical protein
MKRNVTLTLDEDLLKLCRHEAVEQDKSLSQWIAGVLSHHVRTPEEFDEARRAAKRRIETGFHLGGRPLDRLEVHER